MVNLKIIATKCSGTNCTNTIQIQILGAKSNVQKKLLNECTVYYKPSESLEFQIRLSSLRIMKFHGNTISNYHIFSNTPGWNV
jgi:hypothetical protein